MSINLLTALVEFRNAIASDIEWHDETRDELAYVRFTVCHSGEFYECTIMDRGDGTFEVTKNDITTI